MKSRLLLNLVLLGIIAILGALVFFAPGKKKPENPPLAKVDEAGLGSITLKNKETITFEKKDGHWRLAAPFQAPANEIRVRQLIDIAKSTVEFEYPVKGEDLAKFELDKPQATLVLGTTTLEFGGADPINLRRYVRIGDKLDLVNDNFFHHLTASATDYVDKKLLPETAKVKEISIPGLKTALGADGKWTKEPADSKAVPTDLASAWATARAIDVKRLEKPVQGDSIRIVLAEGSPVEFTIAQREPELLLARPDLGLQYELTAETAHVLLNLPKTDPRPGAMAPGSEPEGSSEDHGEDPPDAGEDVGGASPDRQEDTGEALQEPADE